MPRSGKLRGLFLGKAKRVVSDPSTKTVDLTLLIGKVRNPDLAERERFDAAVDLAEKVDAKTVTELILVMSPAGKVTPLTFDLLHGAFEYVSTLTTKEK